MQHAKIIAALARSAGDQVQLARELKVSEPEISKWKWRGIPAHRWRHVLAVALRYELPLTARQIENGSPLLDQSRARKAKSRGIGPKRDC